MAAASSSRESRMAAARTPAERTLLCLQNLRVGSRVLAYYDPHDDYWHERVLLAQIAEHRFVVLTAHWDIYDEDLSQAMRLLPLGPRGGLPIPPPGGNLLRVDAARLAAELDQLYADGEELAAQVRAGEGLPPVAAAAACADGAAAAGPPGAVAPGGGAAAALGAVPGRAADAGAAAPDGVLRAPATALPAPAPAGAVWLAAEARGGFTLGTPIPADLLSATGQPRVVLGDRGIVLLASGAPLAVAVANTLDPGVERFSSISSDLRTLPVAYSPSGTRTRSFHDAVAKMSTTPFADWRIKGPRTTAWLLQKISEGGYTPLQRHFWWRSVQGLTASDAGVDDHHFLSELLQELTTYDQLNAGELVLAEIICRRYQLWEELYASSLREAEAGQDAAPWLDERAIFLGQERSRGSALVCPALEGWVAERLKEESAILKERRKGREERLLERGAENTGAPSGDTAAAAKAKGRGGRRGRGI